MNQGHETQDVDVSSLLLISVMLLLGGLLILAIVWIFLHSLQTKRMSAEGARPPVGEQSDAFPKPRLETRPAVTLEKVRADEEARLNSYGWVDRNAGIVHIPIERAMQLIVTRGLPEVGGSETPLQLMQGTRPEEPRK